MSGVQRPAMVAVVDHEPGLAAVDADVLAGNKASLVGGQEQHYVGDVQGIAHPACGLLDGVGAFVESVSGVDPAGRIGINMLTTEHRKCALFRSYFMQPYQEGALPCDKA